VSELEQAVGADRRLLGQPLAVDAKGCAVQELIGVLDAARAEPSDVVISDSAQVFERPIHL
jgi:hypothetical protein